MEYESNLVSHKLVEEQLHTVLHSFNGPDALIYLTVTALEERKGTLEQIGEIRVDRVVLFLRLI